MQQTRRVVQFIITCCSWSWRIPMREILLTDTSSSGNSIVLTYATCSWCVVDNESRRGVNQIVPVSVDIHHSAELAFWINILSSAQSLHATTTVRCCLSLFVVFPSDSSSMRCLFHHCHCCAALCRLSRLTTNDIYFFCHKDVDLHNQVKCCLTSSWRRLVCNSFVVLSSSN